jgi:hypothetical protein
MNKERGYSEDAFEESDQFAEHGFELHDAADTEVDETGRRQRKRRSNLSSRQRIEDFQEAKWLRSHLQDWDDWDDERSAL